MPVCRLTLACPVLWFQKFLKLPLFSPLTMSRRYHSIPYVSYVFFPAVGIKMDTDRVRSFSLQM